MTSIAGQQISTTSVYIPKKNGIGVKVAVLITVIRSIIFYLYIRARDTVQELVGKLSSTMIMLKQKASVYTVGGGGFDVFSYMKLPHKHTRTNVKRTGARGTRTAFGNDTDQYVNVMNQTTM